MLLSWQTTTILNLEMLSIDIKVVIFFYFPGKVMELSL